MIRPLTLAIFILGARIAFAQAPVSTDKTDAKSLMQSGVKLLEAKDYLGALAVFRDAYTRFPSAKILLNIGTTLKLLDRKAEAANAYQRYLDSPDSDSERRHEVADVIAELDKSIGVLEITITPDDVQLQFTDEWIPAKLARVWRVEPGAFTVKARRDGYQPDSKSANIARGEKAGIVINLVAIPETTPVTPQIVTVTRDGEVRAVVEQPGPRSRFGALAVLHVSVLPRIGSAVLIGATADLTDQLEVDVALLLGPGLVSAGSEYMTPPPSYGGYVGASYAFMTGALRPRASLGLPVFASDGAKVAARVAGGIEYVTSRHVAVMFDLGVEWNFSAPSDIREVALVPAVAVSGRL